MSTDDAANIKNTDIAGYLKLPPVKLHCSMLAEEAIKKAIEDLRQKSTEVWWFGDATDLAIFHQRWRCICKFLKAVLTIEGRDQQLLYSQI